MRIRQLEYFVEVCDTGSITAAAERLNVAQPALGMQIKALERQLGIELLVRTRRGTTTTKAGEIFLEEARHILGRMRDVRRRLKEMETTGNATVTLGLSPSLATVLTGPLLEALRKAAPTVKLHIHEDFSHTLIDYLEAGELDLALAYSVPENDRLEREPLLTELLFLVAKPGSQLGVEGAVPFRALSQVDFVMPSPRDFIRQVIEATMDRHGGRLHVAYEVESIPAMKEMAMSGMAYAILPYANIVREIAGGSLVARQIVDPPISRILYAVRQTQKPQRQADRKVFDTLKSLLEIACRDNPALFPLDSSAADAEQADGSATPKAQEPSHQSFSI
jgi:LysR family nitrogen assimilation transcriptional regulator